MRQGNDVGTQYRSAIYFHDDEQRDEAEARESTRRSSTARATARSRLRSRRRRTFYYAEDYHQQYLAKNPGGYCGLGGTGVSARSASPACNSLHVTTKLAARLTPRALGNNRATTDTSHVVRSLGRDHARRLRAVRRSRAVHQRVRVPRAAPHGRAPELHPARLVAHGHVQARTSCSTRSYGRSAACCRWSRYAWIGRVVCWAALAALLVALMRRLQIGLLAGTLAVLAWMPWELRIVGGDWMFGTFEAKPLAYIAMLGALAAALNRHVWLRDAARRRRGEPSPRCGRERRPRHRDHAARRLDHSPGSVAHPSIAIIAAIPGVVGVVHDMHGSTANRDVYRFIARDVYPFHMDPWYWGKLTFFVLIAMAAVNAWYAYNGSGSHGLKLLAHFELVCAIPTLLGVVAWETGRYEYLRFFPFRVFPVVVSVGFALTAAHALPRWWRARHENMRLTAASVVTGAIVLTVLVARVAQDPVREAAFLARRTLRGFTGYTDSSTQLTDSYHWIRDHTPADSVVISPPAQDPHYDTDRPQITQHSASTRWDTVAEWKRRVLAQLGPSDTAARAALDRGVSFDDEYHALTPRTCMRSCRPTVRAIS